MSRKGKLLLAVLLCAGLLGGCGAPAGQENATPSPGGDEGGYIQMAKSALEALRQGDPQIVIDQLEDTVREQVTAEQLQAAWDQQILSLGALQSVTEALEQAQGDQTVVQLLCQHENGVQYLICAYDSNGKLVAFYFQPAEDLTEKNSWILPDGVTEKTVKIGAGTPLEVSGTITLPAGDGPFPAVVLVHGSGSLDQDETIGANKPFRDLAYGLAARGIGVIRYDKAPYAHPEAFTGTDYTVDDEYTGTVLAALQTLRENANVSNVYVLGHSEGGMLTPYLIEQSNGEFAGGIIMAGTPRKLWEVSLDQNMALLETMPEEQRAAYREQLEQERARAIALDQGQYDAQARENMTIFGIPAEYLYQLDQIDPAALAKQVNVPLLILQGESDFQVSVEKDFEAWKSAIGAENEIVSYRSYEGLNHLFLESKGDNMGTIAEYNEPGHIPAMVLDDIMVWIQTLQ